MSNKRLNAVVTIGGAVAGSLKSALKTTSARLADVGQNIGQIKKRQDLLSKSIDTFGRQGKDVSRMREEYARLGQEMETLRRKQQALKRMQDADLSGSFSRMTSQVGGLVTKAAALGGVAAGGVFALANSTAELGDKMAKTADQLGVGVERWQQMTYAGERSGLQIEQTTAAMHKLVTVTGQAVRGGKSQAEMFESIGLSASALASMSPDEALNQIADALANVENHNQKAAIAAQIFGEEAGPRMLVMLKDGSAGLRQLYKDAEATGYVLSEKAARDAEVFQDRLLDAKLAISGMKNTLGAQLMPVVTKVFERFSGYMRENRGQVEQFANKFAGLVEKAIPALIQLAESGVQFATTLAKIGSTVAGLVGGFDNLATISAILFSAKAIGSVVGFGVSLFKVGSAVVSLAGGLPVIAGGIKAIGLALMANPIGLIIGGIALAAGLIWKYWEPIKGFVSKLWNGVTAVLSNTWEGIKTLFSWSPIGMLISNWGGISDFFTNLWGGIIDSARAAFDWIAGKLAWIGDAWNAVKGWFGSGDSGGSSAQPSTEVSSAPAASVPQVAAAGGTSMGDVSISVTAAPGQDARAIAEQVWQLFQQKMDQQRRGALYDSAGAY